MIGGDERGAKVYMRLKSIMELVLVDSVHLDEGFAVQGELHFRIGGSRQDDGG